MSKCGQSCDIYSRVTGYYRPINNWNKGKKEEFHGRVTFSVPDPATLNASIREKVVAV